MDVDTSHLGDVLARTEARRAKSAASSACSPRRPGRWTAPGFAIIAAKMRQYMVEHDAGIPPAGEADLERLFRSLG